MVWSNELNEYWKAVRETSLHLAKEGHVIITRMGKAQGYRIRVLAPYDPVFVAMAERLGGIYRKRTYTWTFPPQMMGIVVKTCREIFPVNKIRVCP